MADISIQEKEMLTMADAFHKALLKVDKVGGLACLTMVVTNYCREMGLDPVTISGIIHESIEEHIEEIREGKV